MCLQTVNRFLAQSFHIGCVKHIKITGGCGFLHFIISLFFSGKHAAVISLGLANLPLQFAARKNRQAGSNGIAVAVADALVVTRYLTAHIISNYITPVISITAAPGIMAQADADAACTFSSTVISFSSFSVVFCNFYTRIGKQRPLDGFFQIQLQSSGKDGLGAQHA